MIIGHLIGTSKNRADPLGNSGDGVRMFSSQGGATENIVGGTLPEAANTIAFNGEDGVQVENNTSVGNGILRNYIHSNDEQGIDLGDDGATANDEDDPDSGPNNLQNKPDLTSAENSGGETTVVGSLNSLSNRTFRIRFFSGPWGNEGKKYIGAKSNITTNANGNVSFDFQPAQAVPAGQTVTATATNPGGNTSEFSAPESAT